MTPFELIHHKLYPAYKAEIENLMQGTATTCETCGRFTADCEANAAYEITGSYGLTTYQCQTCRIFSLQSFNLVGYDMPNRAQSLLGFKSAYLIFPLEDAAGELCFPLEDAAVELWTGGKYLEKVSTSAPFICVDRTGNKAKLALLERDRPELVIELSIRKELWSKHLQIGDAKNLIVATETGCQIIPRTTWPAFKASFVGLDKKTRAEALIVLRGITSGRLEYTSDRVQKLFKQNPDFAAACKNNLPDNPLARLFYFDAVGVAE